MGSCERNLDGNSGESGGHSSQSRREILRKTGIGAGIGAAATIAPSIGRLAVAPSYAAAQSIPCPCSTENLIDVQGILPVTVLSVVTNSGDGTCQVELSGDLLLPGFGPIGIILVGNGGPLPLSLTLFEDPIGSGVFSGSALFPCIAGDAFVATGVEVLAAGLPADFDPLNVVICACN